MRRRITSAMSSIVAKSDVSPCSVSNRASNVASFKVMDILARANYLQTVEKKNVLHCEVGQPQSGAPVAVARAASEALVGPQKQVMGYTDAFGLFELRHKISEHYKAIYGKVVDPECVVVTTGSSGGFLLAFTACFDVGDVVAVVSISWHEFFVIDYINNMRFSRHHLVTLVIGIF